MGSLNVCFLKQQNDVVTFYMFGQIYNDENIYDQ